MRIKRTARPQAHSLASGPRASKKRRFKTMQEAKDYEAFTKLFGREPPAIEDGGLPLVNLVTER
jgi:hypothetical protein